MYDLWQGTVQSQDDALQLLLTVDYIWSWARDLYRPSVIKHLSSTLNNVSDWNSAFSNRFCPSVSLSARTSPILKAEDPDEMQIDDIPETTESSSDKMYIEPTRSLKITMIPQLPSSWTGIGKIRHSNIINLEHRVGFALLPRTGWEWVEAHQILKLLFSLRITMSSGTMSNTHRFWEKDEFFTLDHDSKGLFETTLLFQTYCDSQTWQIKRVKTHIRWEPSESPSVGNDHLWLPPHLETSELAVLLREAQEIHGAGSVQCAIQNQNWVLAPDENQALTWRSFHDLNIPQNALEMLKKKACLRMTKNFTLSGDKMTKKIIPSLCEQQNSITRSLEQNPLTGDSIIAIDRSTGQPRFCLFVTSPRDDWADRAVLHELLQEAVHKKNFCGDLEPRLGQDELQTLRRWIRYLKY